MNHNVRYQLRAQQQHAQIGDFGISAAVVAAAALASALGVEWSDVGDWIGEVFGKDAVNANGLTEAGQRAEDYANAFKPESIEEAMIDEATVRKFVVDANNKVGPKLGSKIWKYWTDVVVPKRRALAEAAAAEAARQAAEEEARLARKATLASMAQTSKSGNVLASKLSILAPPPKTTFAASRSVATSTLASKAQIAPRVARDDDAVRASGRPDDDPAVRGVNPRNPYVWIAGGLALTGLVAGGVFLATRKKGRR